MEISQIQSSLREAAFIQANSKSQGFAVVTVLALIPLVFVLMICVGAALFALKRKSLAQSICVQQVSRLQSELKKPLSKLLHMNPQAMRLRARRIAADNNLRTARLSGYPPAIAIAGANQLAVILEQVQFQMRQQALLAEARRIRSENERDLRQRAGRMGAENIRGQSYYLRALAVEPKPQFDLSPNYETVPGFSLAQQHRFTYRVDVLAEFPRALQMELPLKQKIECAASLSQRSGDWDLQILAARAQ